MNSFRLTILGTNAAGPAFGRISSSQVIEYNDQIFLMDCAEATQIRLSEYKIKRKNLNTICISHLHGDHVFGLPGLLGSFSLNNRVHPLTLIGPVGLKDYVQSILKHTSGRISYEIIFIELDHAQGIKSVYNSSQFEIAAFPMKHRVSTYGYKFQEIQPSFNINKQALKDYQLTIEEIKLAKTGKDVSREDGTQIENKKLTITQKPPRSYAYCSDTIYDEEIIPYISGVDFLYHETTYTHDLLEQANERMHTTAYDAGRIAHAAKVGKLITGHYSSRYKYVDVIVEDAMRSFPRVLKGYDGFMVNIEPQIK